MIILNSLLNNIFVTRRAQKKKKMERNYLAERKKNIFYNVLILKVPYSNTLFDGFKLFFFYKYGCSNID